MTPFSVHDWSQDIKIAGKVVLAPNTFSKRSCCATLRSGNDPPVLGCVEDNSVPLDKYPSCIAGFQVIMNGRFWVITEAPHSLHSFLAPE